MSMIDKFVFSALFLMGAHGKASDLASRTCLCDEAAIPAQVVEIVDGDTLQVNAMIWPGQSVKTNVRLKGIDAPEKGQPGYLEAHAAVRTLIQQPSVTLCDPHHGKYAGRVVARVLLPDGRDLSEALLKAGLVRRYP